MRVDEGEMARKLKNGRVTIETSDGLLINMAINRGMKGKHERWTTLLEDPF